MKGSYKFIIDGKQVAEQENMITSAGKIAILRYLASIVSSYANSIGIGVSTTDVTLSDTSLGYEIFRAPILIKSVDYSSSAILFKATFPTGTKTVIEEVCLWPNANVDRGRLLFVFDTSEIWTNASSTNTSDIRIGSSGISDTTTSGGSVDNVNSTILKLDTLLLSDIFSLAFITYDDNCDYIRITLTDVNGATMYADFVPSSHVAGPGSPQYQIINVLKSVFTGQTNVWEQVISIDITVQAKAAVITNVVLDGLRINDSNVPTGSEIISRAVLSTPITKEANSTLDIEYTITVPI